MEEFYQFNRAYYIQFRQVESESYLQNYIFPNFGKLLDKDFDECIAIEEDENGNDCMIIFLEDAKINDLISFCEAEDIIDYHGDITYRLLTHDNLEEVIQKMLSSDEFEKQFQQFFEKNVTIDSILDKIQLNGENSLSPFEFDYLQKEVIRNRTNNLHK